MKAILTSFIRFLLLCIVGSVAGGFFFMLYNGCVSYVIGSGGDLFSLKFFVDGILLAFPAMLFFVPMFLILPLMKHGLTVRCLGLLTIAVLSLAAWLFVVPLCAKGALETNVLFEKPASQLSPGFFRKINGKIYYFSNVDGIYVSGLRFENGFDARNSSSQDVQVLKDDYVVFERDIYGFSDPIVGENLKPPVVVSVLFLGMFSMVRSTFSACASGILNWLSFSSIMFALLFVGFLLSLSSWRLVNAFFIIFSTFAIIVLNYLYLNFYFSPLLNQFDNMGGFFIFLKNNFQLFMNVVIIIVLCVVGVISFYVSNKKNFERLIK